MRYDSWSFTEPFHVVMPDSPPGAMPWFGPRSLRFGNVYWDVWLIDDQPVQADVCDPSKGRLADVPATPEAVGEWLRSSSRLAVSEPIELTVDGQTALRFDTEPTDGCDDASQMCLACPGRPHEGLFLVGFRVYAIPTGDDTIIAVVNSDPGSLEDARGFGDDLVRSLDFD
jgi:hypothetical protein